MNVKKECEFGAKCYRQNPKHLEEFFHPVEDLKLKNKTQTKRRRKDSSPKKLLKQTKLDFLQRAAPQDVQKVVKEESKPDSSCRQKNSSSFYRPRKSKRKPTPLARTIVDESSEESDTNTSNVCDVTSTSWIFQTSEKKENSVEDGPKAIDVADVEGKIKKLFLVEMPQDFYTFYEFCKTIDANKPNEVLCGFGLRLVGPFDVLTGGLSPGSVTSESALCHWRFFMDPPEFQTVLVANKGLHFGYWRDEPQSKDTFIVSNTVPDYKIKMEAATIFGAVLLYLENYLKQCSPFEKVKVNSLMTNLKQWAESRSIDLKTSNEAMALRKKNVVARTFNDIGIVVPLNKKTEVGYRPLLETNANLKKLCQAIVKTKNTDSPQMEEIERLVNAANIANDEADFGNGLELGIDLFCMGSEIFDDFVEHLMSTAYSLLKRPEWAEVIKAHLKNRRPGLELSVIKK